MNQTIAFLQPYLFEGCHFNLVLQCSSTWNCIACISCESKAIP